MAGFLSRIFGPSKPASPTWSKLAEAKKTRLTGFGEYADLSAESEETRIETPIGTYVIHRDGTFTDETSGLMWVQGFWGMNFNGRRFKGEYLRLPWVEATSLFGRGGVLPKPANLTKEFLHEHGKVSYTPGRCRVVFAGYSNWRLPTAEELLTLSVSDKEAPGFYHFNDSKASELRERLFPDCPLEYRNIWSANENGGFAWAFDSQDALGDYKKREDRFAVLFVRGRGPSPA